MKKWSIVGMICLGVSLAFSLPLAAEVGKSTPKGFTDDFAAAKVEAKKANKKMFVVFSGSDWCSWCQKLEKDYLAKPEFVEAARKDFVLVFIDSPRDKSVLSDVAQKNNADLLKRYKVRGFPTVKVLDAEGGEIAESRPKGQVSPKDYAEQVRHDATVGLLLKKHLGPLEAALRRILEETTAEMMKQMNKGGTDKAANDEAAQKAEFERGQMLTRAFLEKVRDFRTTAAATRVPDEVAAEKTAFLDRVDNMIEIVGKSLKITFEEAKKMREEARQDNEGRAKRDGASARGLVVPLPKDAKLETEYFEKVAVPFYTKWIVDAYRPPAGTKPAVAEQVRTVRRALVRALATGRSEFPTHEEFELAHRLWREKCRDAAVAILHNDGLDKDDQFWQSEKIYDAAVKTFDASAEPFMGYFLRHKAMLAARVRLARYAKADLRPIRAAEIASAKSFAEIVDVFKKADRRIAERLDVRWTLPQQAVERLGNEYLIHCHHAARNMAMAFDKRGSGWGADLTDEQANGWSDYNANARSNLTMAVSLRPEDARASMMLASLNSRSCGSRDPIALMNRAVSNSLDCAAESIERVLHFQTSRWGGSTDFLLDVIRTVTTNVCTQSTFAYRTAATALGKIFIAETGHIANTNLANVVLTPELSQRLYAMFDAYIAAPESPYMPSRDTFVGMGVAFAIQKRDWKMVRKYVAQYRKPLTHWQQAWWARTACHSSDKNYVINMFTALGRDAKRRELLIDAEIAQTEGRLSDADAIYRKLRSMRGLSKEERIIVDRQGYRVRKLVQEAAGGWVDVMPTETASEAESWWGRVVPQRDGCARIVGGAKSYYRLEIPLPGKGAEYEATVHFEKKDGRQKEWFIGWGLARPYTDFDAKDSAWAFPYIGFWRDAKGDHVEVECPVRENAGDNVPSPKTKYGMEQGMFPKWAVYQGDLETRDTHDFRLRWNSERISVFVDGKEVWSIPTETALSESFFRDRVQSDYSVLPVWKLFKNTSFSGYRYRQIKD